LKTLATNIDGISSVRCLCCQEQYSDTGYECAGFHRRVLLGPDRVSRNWVTLERRALARRYLGTGVLKSRIGGQTAQWLEAF
jgi:hypothetical protein